MPTPTQTVVQQHALAGRQKAAALMVTLGPEFAAQVFRHLKQDEIEQLTLEMAAMRRVDPEVKDDVLRECRDLIMAKDYIQSGGLDYAREVLERVFGSGRAGEIIDRLTATLQVRPFEFARQSDPSQVLNFIQHEHPQTIALILAYLNPQQASTILSALEPEQQVDVARRVASMNNTSPEVVKEVERVLERKFASLVTEGMARAGGVDTVVAVLNHADRATEKRILTTLETEDPELAQSIRKRMFVFDDLTLLDDRSLQRAMREVDLNGDMPLALKVAGDEVKTKIMKNLSKRAGEMLAEAIELLGPVRLREVEDAQQRIVAVIRHLEDEGEIVISRGKDEIIV